MRETKGLKSMTYERWSALMGMYWTIRKLRFHYIENEQMDYRVAMQWSEILAPLDDLNRLLVDAYPEYVRMADAE